MTDHFNPRALDTIAYKNGIRSDTKLATHLGVSTGTIYAWRKGLAEPSFASILKMTADEGIPFEDLIAETPISAAQAA